MCIMFGHSIYISILSFVSLAREILQLFRPALAMLVLYVCSFHNSISFLSVVGIVCTAVLYLLAGGLSPVLGFSVFVLSFSIISWSVYCSI